MEDSHTFGLKITMIDIDKKIKEMEENCFELAKKDAKKIEYKVDKLSTEKLEQKVEDYKKELEIKYEKELKKINQEYNRKCFDLEKDEKQKINSFRNSLKNNIEISLEEEFKNFSNSNEYEEFLFKKIDKCLSSIKESKDKTSVGILEKDIYKYGEKIKNKYNFEIFKIDDFYIGGCILENKLEKILLDNTIKTSITEKMTNVSF